METIYLDHNATTPIHPEVAAAVAECQRSAYGNPASLHAPGRRAQQMLEEAREGIASLLGANLNGPHPDRVIFTSGGTEANNLAVFGLTARHDGHVVVSSLEHPSVAEPVAELGRRGWRVDRLPVDRNGVVRHDLLSDFLCHDTRLVCVMLANNETGVLQPLGPITTCCAEAGVHVHTDAVQVAGKLPIDFTALGVTTLSISGHKFHGPRGVGALLVRGDVELAASLFGGFQQSGLRPGTEAVPLAVGLHKALAIWQREHPERRARLRALRDRFESGILQSCAEAVVIGRNAERLPQTSNLSFPGLDRQALIMRLDLAGVACSTGSACASGSTEPSASLLAMGLDEAVLDGSLRFSLGAFTTEAEMDEALQRIINAYHDLRSNQQRRKLAFSGRGEESNSV